MKGDKAAAAAKSSPEEKSQQQPQPRAAQQGNHAGRQIGRQGGSGSQEQPKGEVMKADRLGDKAAVAAKSSTEGKS